MTKITYRPLWKILVDRKMTKTQLRIAVGFSTATLASLNKDNLVSLDLLLKICDYLNVSLREVAETYKEEYIQGSLFENE